MITSDPVLPPPNAAPTPESTATADGADTQGTVQPFDTVPSPAGCTGQTDYPHKSGNYASVHGRMKCTTAVARVETATILYRDRWYGPEQLEADSSGDTNSTSSGDAHPHWDCSGEGIYTYKGFSQHASLENGVRYTASTTNWQVPGMSRFNC